MAQPSQKHKPQILGTLLDKSYYRIFRNRSTQDRPGDAKSSCNTQDLSGELDVHSATDATLRFPPSTSQITFRKSNDLQSTRSSRNTSIQHLPCESDLHSTTDVTLRSLPKTSRKTFKKSNDARRDISVLAMVYVLQDNPTIQDLVLLIISLKDRNDGKFSEIVALSVTFTLQLISFHEKDSSKALTAIADFLLTTREIDAMAQDPTDSVTVMDYMKDRINSSITQIKVLSLSLLSSFTLKVTQNAHPTLCDRDRNIGGNEGFAGILDTMIGATSTILNIFNDASGVIPVPFVKPLVASVTSLLKAVQQTRSNLDDMRQVAAVAGEFVVMLAVACSGHEVEASRSFRQALDRFQSKLHDIAQLCIDLSNRNVLWRFLQQGVDQNSLSGIKQDLENAVLQFQTETQLLQHLDLRSLGQVINNKLDQDAVDALPKPYSHVGRRDEYLPGSRSDVIQIISNWLEDPNQRTFWIRGGAGLGKSTLAHELVDSLQTDGRLATFMFLLRGSSIDPATVIQTMARELGASHPRAIPQVAEAARTCKGSHRPLREYLEAYIIKPVCSLSYPYPLVIIIDGLDEWEHHEMFLKELEHITPSSPVKILLMSRPHHSIERSLLNVAVQKYELPPVSPAIMKQYFNYHFAKIDWEMRKPSSFAISDLVRLADGLLIWAAMVCSFLTHEMRAGPPHQLLDQMLSSGKRISLHGQLSNLYHDALTQLFRDETSQKLFRRVFGAMTVLQQSLSLDNFSCLLGISRPQVKGVLSRLTALQTRSTFDERMVPLSSQCFHSSFVEFTMNEEVEADYPYLINPQMVHQFVAEGSLRLLSEFLSSFRGSKCSHSDLRDLELYTVKFWPLHVANSNDRMVPLPPTLENLLRGLPETHLRRWATWFLTINLPTSQDWNQVVGGIDKDGFHCSLANFLINDNAMDTTLMSHRIFCLEVSVRLEPQLEKAWEALGWSYQQRFDNNDTLDLLNNAIVVYRHALDLYSKYGRHFNSMYGLATALWSRFQRTGSITDLEEAISLHRELIFLRPPSHPDHSSSLNFLGGRLVDRFRMTGSMADLEEAISIQRESISLCPGSHPNRSVSLNNLGLALRDRFITTGLMADLEEAILIFHESLSLRPPPHSRRPSSLDSLASALINRFEETGSMTDLDEATSMYRESLSLCPSPHPRRSLSLRHLALALRSHFKKTGSIMVLEEAILMFHESLSLCPIPNPYRPLSLNNLSSALCDRFKIKGSMADLEEALLMQRESLSLCPALHTNRIFYLRNLACILESLSNENGQKSDEATSLCQEILAIESLQ